MYLLFNSFNFKCIYLMYLLTLNLKFILRFLLIYINLIYQLLINYIIYKY